MPSEGPNYADSVTSVAEDVGGVAWTNPGNAAGPADGSYATVSLPGTNTISEALTFLDFDMGIPADANPVGIVAGINCNQPFLPDTEIRDHHVRLILSGAQTGDDKADTGTNWSTIVSLDAFVDHGGSLDTWGTTPTAAQVNATDFGFTVSCKQHGSGTRTGSVDSGRMTVFYEEAGQPTQRRWKSVTHLGGGKRFAQSGSW